MKVPTFKKINKITSGRKRNTKKFGHAGIWCDIIVFNDGHLLHVRSEAVAVRRRLNMVLDDYEGQMIPGYECGLHFLTFVLHLRKNPGETSTRKLTRSGFEPWPTGWEITILHLDHSCGITVGKPTPIIIGLHSMLSEQSRVAFLKLWSAYHLWSSRSALEYYNEIDII